MKFKQASKWLTLLGGSLLTLSASPLVIGVAQSPGALYLNHAAVPGSATVVDGASLQTGSAASNVRLTNGGRIRLGAGSTANMFRDRMVLERGMAEVGSAANYGVQAGTLRIEPADAQSRFTVAVKNGNRVSVSSTGGSADVRNAGGVLVARVFPDAPREFSPADNAKVELNGVLTRKGSSYLLTDEATHVTVEVRGDKLNSLVGKKVHVVGTLLSGATVAAGATQVVTVSSVSVAAAAAGAGAAGAGAAAATGAAVSTGIGVGTVAVIGGVATAATVGGLAAAGTLSSDSSSSSVSR